MRALVPKERAQVAVSVEAALRTLRCSYIKNQGRSVTEFVVSQPCHLNITVEDLTRARSSLVLRRGLNVESSIEVRRSIGAPEGGRIVRETSEALARELRAEVPEKSWDGPLDAA